MLEPTADTIMSEAPCMCANSRKPRDRVRTGQILTMHSETELILPMLDTHDGHSAIEKLVVPKLIYGCQREAWVQQASV